MAGPAPDLEHPGAVGRDRGGIGGDAPVELAEQEPAEGVVEDGIANENASGRLVPSSAMAAMADNNGYYGVSVLNLWGDMNHTQPAQDQLIVTVPDGRSTVMLLGLGFLGLAVCKWKLNRRIQAA